MKEAPCSRLRPCPKRARINTNAVAAIASHGGATLDSSNGQALIAANRPPPIAINSTPLIKAIMARDSTALLLWYIQLSPHKMTVVPCTLMDIIAWQVRRNLQYDDDTGIDCRHSGHAF